MVLSETSHPGEHRPDWLHFITKECHAIIKSGIPLGGICWYPIIDRPDWNHLHLWHLSGIWDVSITEDNDIECVLNETYCERIANCTTNDG